MEERTLYFVAADADQEYCEQLAMASSQPPFTVRHRGRTEAGADTAQQLQRDMEQAAAIFLLASPDFLADKRILEEEMPLALAQHKNRKTPVVPIIIRPCQWEQVAPLTRMPLILPNKNNQVGFPVSRWDNRDEALKQIAEEVKKLL